MFSKKKSIWLPDPLQLYDLREFKNGHWTKRVKQNNRTFNDPYWKQNLIKIDQL